MIETIITHKSTIIVAIALLACVGLSGFGISLFVLAKSETRYAQAHEELETAKSQRSMSFNESMNLRNEAIEYHRQAETLLEAALANSQDGVDASEYETCEGEGDLCYEDIDRAIHSSAQKAADALAASTGLFSSVKVTTPLPRHVRRSTARSFAPAHCVGLYVSRFSLFDFNGDEIDEESELDAYTANVFSVDGNVPDLDLLVLFRDQKLYIENVFDAVPVGSDLQKLKGFMALRYGPRGSLNAPDERNCNFCVLVPTIFVESRLLPFIHGTLPAHEAMPLGWADTPRFGCIGNDIVLTHNTPSEIREILDSEEEAAEIDAAFAEPYVDEAPSCEHDEEEEVEILRMIDTEDSELVEQHVPTATFDEISKKLDDGFVDDTVIQGMFAGSESSASMIPSLDATLEDRSNDA